MAGSKIARELSRFSKESRTRASNPELPWGLHMQQDTTQNVMATPSWR
jgi:hypothetical protein